MQDYIEEQVTTPIGTVISFMGNKAPKGYLICDGMEYQISDYPEFTEYLKEQFDNIQYFGGIPEQTFCVPDLRGEFLRGAGTNSHTNQGSGETPGIHQNGSGLPYIWNYNNITVAIDVGNSNDITFDSAYALSRPRRYRDVGMQSGSAATQSTIITVRPTNTSVLYCIKAKHLIKDKVNNND